MKNNFEFKAKVWKWPGLGSWWFVNVPDSISSTIRQNRGKGLINISVTLGKSNYNTTLFPHNNSKGDFGYLMSIRKKIREKEEIFEDDTIKIHFRII